MTAGRASWTCTCGAINAATWATCGRCSRPESARRILYSAGYSDLQLDAFCEFVEREDLVVVDVRLKPSVRNTTWSRKTLLAHLGARYAALPELGNLNYKGGPIELQDEATGLAKLRALLQQQSVVVLCVCADPAVCHRTVIVQRLADDEAARFERLALWVEVRPLPGSLYPVKKGGV